MIEVTACRDLTSKEKRKIEIEKQIKELEAEKETLDSEETIDSEETEEINGIKIIVSDDSDEDIKVQTMMAAEVISSILNKSGTDTAVNNIDDELTEEEAKVVSKAISKDNNNSLDITDEQLKDIKRATEIEYNKIKASNKPRNIAFYIIIAIAAIWVIISALNAISLYGKSSVEGFKDVEHITIPINPGGEK